MEPGRENKLNNRVSFDLSEGQIRRLESKKEPQRITFVGVNFEVFYLYFDYDDEKDEFFLAHLRASTFDDITLGDGTVIRPVAAESGDFSFDLTQRRQASVSPFMGMVFTRRFGDGESIAGGLNNIEAVL
jgi:hypothetical protein